MIRGEPLRTLAARTGTSASALVRHRVHISASLAEAQQSTDIAVRKSAWQRLEEVKRDTDQLAARARQTGNDRLQLQVLMRQEKQIALETQWAKSPEAVRTYLGVAAAQPPAAPPDYSRLSDEERTQFRTLVGKVKVSDKGEKDPSA